MGRKRTKDKSIITVALNSGWVFSATLATVILIATLLAPSLVSNPYLKPLLLAITTLGLIVAGVLYLIACFKFIKRERKPFSQTIDIRKEPSVTSLSDYDLPIDKTINNIPSKFSVPEITPSK